MRLAKIAAIFAITGILSTVQGESVGWRMDGTGRFAQASGPVRWSGEKNIQWKTAMPDWSNASPVLVGGRLFVCAEPATLICVDAESGKILWQRSNTYEDIFTAEQLATFKEDAKKTKPIEDRIATLDTQTRKLRAELRKNKDPELRKQLKAIGKENQELTVRLQNTNVLKLPRTHKDSGFSAPTPVSDGRNVYVVFATGVVACYDLDGNRQWAKFVEKPVHAYGHSASPVLAGDKLIVHIGDLVALNCTDGLEQWRTKAKVSWGTPIVVRIQDTDVLIVPAEGTFVRAADGKVLVAKTGKLKYAAPVIHDGVVYFIENQATAFRLPAGTDEKPTQLWTSKIKGSRHYGSAVIHGGLIYAVSREEIFTVMEADTGKVVYSRKLKIGRGVNSAYPSVTLAGKYIHVGCQAGTTVVLEPGRTYSEVARNKLEGYRSTPIFDGNRMYLRGLKNLYCIGADVPAE